MASRSEQALFAIHISQFRTPNFEFVSRFNGPYSRYHRLTTTHSDYVIYCPYPCVPRTLAPLVTNSSHVWLLCHSEYGLGLGFRSLTVAISGPVLLHVISETGWFIQGFIPLSRQSYSLFSHIWRARISSRFA